MEGRASISSGEADGARAAPATTLDETGLLETLRAGEPSAFERLVRGYGGRMRAAAVRVLGNEQDADDAVQEAFLSAFRALPRFEGKSRVGTWLHRITINAALMKRRTRERHPEEQLDELLPRFTSHGGFATSQRSWEQAPAAPAERAELCERVRRCIAELPETYRVALVLRDLEGLDNAEVAQNLGITINAAKVRIHRARQALRTLLEPHVAKDLP